MKSKLGTSPIAKRLRLIPAQREVGRCESHTTLPDCPCHALILDMADTCCIHSRAIAVALVVNSIVTLATVGALVATSVKSDPSCPAEVKQPLLAEPVIVEPPQTQWASLVRDF